MSRLCALLAVLALAVATGCGDDDGGGGGYGGGGDSEEKKPSQAQQPPPAQQERKKAPAGDEVEIADFKFQPAEIRVKRGGKLTWSNTDAAAHTATAEDGSFDTGTIEQKGSKSVTLERAGTIAYICDFHPYMTGKVVVE
jgi:plastocyanin